MTDNETEQLPLVIVGYDFRRAPTGWRSRLAMPQERHDALARRLEDAQMAGGFVALDTCNRNEWIASTISPKWTGEVLRAQMIRLMNSKTVNEPPPKPYVHIGSQAVRHLLRVSAGLESFVVGERQIASQVNQAFMVARENGRSSVILNGLAPICGRAAKDALLAGVGDCSLRGVHDAAVQCLTQRYRADGKSKVLVVGTGTIGRRVVDGLRHRTSWDVVACNRTIRKDSGSDIHPLSELPQLLQSADMAVVCTGAFRSVLMPEHLRNVDPGAGLILVDLGIPTQIDPACRFVEGVEVIDLDGLQQSVEIRTDKRELRLLLAKFEVLVHDFERYCRERELVKVLKTTQSEHDHYVRQEIPALIDSELPTLSEDDKRRLEFRLRGLLRRYTNSIFDSIHRTAAEKDHGEQ